MSALVIRGRDVLASSKAGAAVLFSGTPAECKAFYMARAFNKGKTPAAPAQGPDHGHEPAGVQDGLLRVRQAVHIARALLEDNEKGSAQWKRGIEMLARI